MNLLEATSERCTFLNRTTTEDGYGGYRTTWTDGPVMNVYIALDNSTAAQTALAAGATGVYTIAMPKNINLRFHDVLRRESDGKIFRVVTDGDDKKTPKTAALNLRVVRAEEWQIPEEDL